MKLVNNSGEAFVDQRFVGAKAAGAAIEAQQYTGCRFVRCDLREAQWRGCRFLECWFEDCDLSMMTVVNCSFRDVHFEKCRLLGVDWTAARWDKDGLLNSIAFANSDLRYAVFFGLKLRRFALVDCVATEVDFTGADLTGAVLTGTDFGGARFNETNLTQADLTGARNYMIDVRANTIKSARFSLPEAMALLHSLEIVLE